MVKVPMNVVTKRTGLSQHVIRVWEKRYGAVVPGRSEGRHRLYSEEEVARLVLLARLTEAGHLISRIATLPTEELESLWLNEGKERVLGESLSESERIVAEAIVCVEQMDRPQLAEFLQKSALRFGAHGSLEKVIGPLAERIGDLWRVGSLSAAHEHFASAVIRDSLWGSTRPFAWSSNAPTLIVATPSGQLHELGAVIVGAAAGDLGWRVIYLGPSLPPAEIASAAVQNRARAVALSIIYPEDDSSLPGELDLLRKFLPKDTAILVGGRAASAYARTFDKIGAKRPANLQALYDELNALRKPRGEIL